MKRIITVILCVMICVSLMTACAGSDSNTAKTNVEELRELYVRAPEKIEEMTAVFLNNVSGETADIKMEKSGGDDGGIIFCCEADVNKYNM